MRSVGSVGSVGSGPSSPTPPSSLTSLTDLRAAASALQGIAVRTPLIEAAPLSARLGVPVWLKCEQFQPIGAFKLRGGYMYRPSPIKDNSGPGNLVDPARHTLTAGLGFDLKELGLLEKEIIFNMSAQYHHLVSQRITKAGGGNEAGRAGESKVGSPGYDIGGSIYGAGFSLSMAF